MSTRQHEQAKPVDVDEKQRAVARGRRAAELLHDELSREVFDEVRERLFREWVAEDRDSESREALWYQVHALEAVKIRLQKIIGDGEHAAAVLQRLQ